MAWNGSRGAEAPKQIEPKKNPAVGKGLLAGIIVVALVGVVWFFMPKTKEAPAVPAEPQPPKQVIADVKPELTLEQRRARAKAHAKDRAAERAAALFAKTNGYQKAPGKMLTDDGRVLTFPAPKGDEKRIVHSHGKIYECDSQGNFIDITPKPIFKNPFEEHLVGMATGAGFIPGMMVGHDETEVRKMLLNPVNIDPNDSPEVVAKKEAVAALKADILAYIDDGGTFDDYVMKLKQQDNAERSLRTQGLKDVVKMLKNGQGQEAVEYCKKYNSIVTEKGYQPLRLPKHINEILQQVEAQTQENN